MRFYSKQHAHTCGIDLHARTMYVCCIVDSKGKIVLHQNMPARAEPLLKAIKRFRKDLVIAVECMFSWYWLPISAQTRGSPLSSAMRST